MSEADWWVCGSCSSLNNLSAGRCYSCAGKRPRRPVRASQVLGYRPVVSWDGKVSEEPIVSPDVVDEVVDPPLPLREPPRRSIVELGGLGPDGARIELGPGGLASIGVPIEPEFVAIPIDRSHTEQSAETQVPTAAMSTGAASEEHGGDPPDDPGAVTVRPDPYLQTRLSELFEDDSDEPSFGEGRDAGSIRAGLGHRDGTPLSGALEAPDVPPSDGTLASPADASPTVRMHRTVGPPPPSPRSGPKDPNASNLAESRSGSESH